METDTLEKKNFPIALSLGVRTRSQNFKSRKKTKKLQDREWLWQFFWVVDPHLPAPINPFPV